MERKRLELSTSALRTHESSDVSDSTKELTSTLSAACTNACTSEPENDNAGTSDAADRGVEGEGLDQGDTLAKLTAALLTLSPADRGSLAAMLKGDNA